MLEKEKYIYPRDIEFVKNPPFKKRFSVMLV